MHLTNLMPPMVVLGIDEGYVATLHLAPRHRRWGPYDGDGRRRRLRRPSAVIGPTPLVRGDPRRGVLEILPLPELQAHQVRVWVELRPVAAVKRRLVMVVVVVIVLHVSSGLVVGREHKWVTDAGVVGERIAGAVPVKPGWSSSSKVSNIPCKVAAAAAAIIITIMPSVAVKRVPAVFHNSPLPGVGR